MGTATPQAATSGASTRETLSPIPPVECLSTRGTAQSPKSSWTPESSIAVVRATSSSTSMPRQVTAISSADIW
jgi:hypothetical protein